MAVVSVYWTKDRAKDIHLIPGMRSPRLDQLLMIGMSGETDTRADLPPPGVSVTFSLNLPGSLPSWLDFDATTGEVTFKSAPPAGTRVLDFLVSVGAAEAGHATDPTYIRFHLHAGLTSIRLTPDKLTMRQLASNVRFTVLAEFTDGTAGDVTNWSARDPFDASDRDFARLQGQPAQPILKWSVIPGLFPAVSVDANTGLLANTSTTAADKVMVEMRPLPAAASRKATADVVGAARWSSSVKLSLIDGPGFRAMNRPNVLILPDGFTETERPEFERLAARLVKRLTKEKRTRPFDLFRGFVNYFSAWVPSREGGISPLPTVDRRYKPPETQAYAQEVDTSVAQEDIAASANIGIPPTPASNTRFLLHERDTAFHVVLGERPQAKKRTVIRGCKFNERRLDHEDFNDFLSALKDDKGASIVSPWRSDGPDRDMIVILCRSNRHGGENNPRHGGGSYICMTLAGNADHRVQEAPAGPGLDLVPDAVPTEIDVNLWTTVAHELCHSFDIADEYGGDNGSFPDIKVHGAREAANVQALSDLQTDGLIDADKILWRWPRIVKAGILANTPTPVGLNMRFQLRRGGVDDFLIGDIVRLRTRPLFGRSMGTFKVVSVSGNHLDIEPVGTSTFNPADYAAGSGVDNVDGEARGMLIAPPTFTGNAYRLNLEPGHGAFAVNDEIAIYRRPSPSGRFRVVGIAGDEIEAEPLAGTVVDDSDNFPAGSILMAPKRAPDPNPGAGIYGDDLELMHASTRARINATHNPLNAKHTDPPDRACNVNVELDSPIRATNYPGGVAPKPPKYSSWIVGLYENGAGFNCDIYHPTGVCLMNERMYQLPGTRTERSYQFCPVCRYAMVDHFDPTRHGDIDADYDPRYPL